MNNFDKMQRRRAAGETILMDGDMGSEIERHKRVTMVRLTR